MPVGKKETRERANVGLYIDIICPLHGTFRQTIRRHKNGQGCRKCGIQKIEKAHRLGRAEWIRRFESVHGRGKYDYSRVPENVIMSEKVEIYCPEHNYTF